MPRKLPCFVVRPLMSEEEATRVLAVLMEGISKFEAEYGPSLETKLVLREVNFEELFRTVYRLVLDRHGKRLYDALHAKFQEHARTMPRRDSFDVKAQTVRDICKYADMTYVADNQLTPIHVLAMRIFDERLAYRTAAMEHWRRHSTTVGKCALALREVYTEVTFRPHNSGAKRSRDEFEAAASALVHDTA